jgi:hypothetical protein
MGQNSLNWKVLYTIENILKPRCLKWALMTHLGTWNISYGQKKGESQIAKFDSQTLKVRNRPDLLVCRWCATYHWKALYKGYNCVLDFTSLRGLQKNYGPPKLWESPFQEFWDSQVGTLETKWHLGVGPWPNTKNTIRWKVMASPKFKPWWILWVCVCLWFVHAPKMLQLCINQLVVWFV